MTTELLEVQDIFIDPPNIDFILFAAIHFGIVYLLIIAGRYFYNSPPFEFIFDFFDSFRSNDLERCYCSSDNIGDFPELQGVLPADYKYAVCGIGNVVGEQLETVFRVEVSTKEQTLQWIEDFQRATHSPFRVFRSFDENTDSHVFKTALVCSDRRRCPRSAECRLLVTLERIQSSFFTENSIVHEEGFPLNVIYQRRHDHSLRSSDVIAGCCSPNTDVEKSATSPQNVPETSEEGNRDPAELSSIPE